MSYVTKIENTIALSLETLMTEHKTKSGVIRYLASIGYPRARIAQFMNIRYQHVRNVLTDEPKKVVAKYEETFIS